MSQAVAATPVPDERAQSRELLEHELDHVCGGMKWTRGTANSDVIDALGGSFTILGIRVTFDAQGGISSIGR